MNRRTLITALLTAPAIIRTPGLLMAIKPKQQFHAYAVTVIPLPDGAFVYGPLRRLRSFSKSESNPEETTLIQSREPLKTAFGITNHPWTVKLQQTQRPNK